MSTALRGTRGQMLCILCVFASKCNWVPLKKGLGVCAVGSWICLGLNPARDTTRVK